MKSTSSARASRWRLIVLLSAVTAVHAAVLMTSEVDGPGSAQLRLSPASNGAMEPGALLTVALVAAVGLCCLAMVMGGRLAPAPVAASGRGRRALLVGAGGGLAAVGVAWAFRGRVPPAPEAPVAVAALPRAAEPLVAAPTAPVATAATAPPSAAPSVPTVAPTAASVPTTAAAAAAPTVAAPPAPAPATATAAPTIAAAPTTAPAATKSAAAVSRPAAEPTYPAEPTAAAKPTVAAAVKPAAAAKPTLQQTQTMPGGRNNYVANAPVVANLGTGFVVLGRILDTAGNAVANTRIQIWLNTYRGGEPLPSNRGSTMTDAEGHYRLETSPAVPVFGQPYVHIAYDDGKYDTLFLRPVLKTEKDPSITVDFVLGRSGVA